MSDALVGVVAPFAPVPLVAAPGFARDWILGATGATIWRCSVDGMIVLAAGITLKLSTVLSEIHDDAPCFARINQPAAAVRLNRPEDAPNELCVSRCAAQLVGTHRESGLVVGIAIYTGRGCF